MCAAIFNNISPNFPSIANKVVAHVKDFMLENASLNSQHFLLNNFSHTDSLFLFYAYNWNGANKVGHLGFLSQIRLILHLVQVDVSLRLNRLLNLISKL